MHLPLVVLVVTEIHLLQKPLEEMHLLKLLLFL